MNMGKRHKSEYVVNFGAIADPVPLVQKVGFMLTSFFGTRKPAVIVGKSIVVVIAMALFGAWVSVLTHGNLRVAFFAVLFVSSLIAAVVYMELLPSFRLSRLQKFAQDNGYTCIENSPSSGDRGIIFEGFSAHDDLNYSVRIIGKIGDVDFSIGNLGPSPGLYGCLTIPLESEMPNILLDATNNNKTRDAADLPKQLRQTQKLSLEGDFDSHFILYCPKQYEQDALQLLTPDVMELLIDESAMYDVEIIGKQLHVYSCSSFDLWRPEVMERLLRIASVVGAKIQHKTNSFSGSYDALASSSDGRSLPRIPDKNLARSNMPSKDMVIAFILLLICLTILATRNH